jgi:exodeoxyribonuclease V beta subunit
MARALKELDLRAVLYRQDGLFDGPEAAACRDLLLAIQTPYDEALRAKALLGPFFGLSFAEAEEARDLPEGHPLLTRLFGWRELAQEGRYGELFTRLVSESGLSQRLLFLDPSQRALTNLLHILELLQQEAWSGHCTLTSLAIQVQRWIDGLDRPAVEDGETQRLERQGGAVQILTMHKAKGLQAPLVVLFGGTSAGMASTLHRYHEPGTGARRTWVGSVRTAPAAVQALIAQEEQDEGERLAYVALTRAEAQLLLPRFVPGAAPPDARSNFDAEGHPKAGLYRGINRRLEALVGTCAAPKASPGIEVIPRSGVPAEVDLPVPEPWAVALPPAPVRPDFQALRRRACPTWIFSYTGLQQGLERLGTEASPLEEDREPTLPGGPRGGKKLGVQVHACLQMVDLGTFAGADLATWKALPATLALAEGLPLEGRAETLRWIHQAMTLPLPLPDGGTVVLAEADEALRELDFLTPYPQRGDFLTGSIDLLFQTRGRAYVLDWKTNRLPGYGAGHLEEAIQGSYLLQVKIYTVTTCRFLGITDRDHYERAFGGVVYLFLRGLPDGGVWTCRPSWEDLRAWERDLEDLKPERLIPAHAGGERHV